MPSHSLPAIFAFAWLFSLGAVVSPGPVSAAVISEAPRRGLRVGVLVAGGHAFLELLMVGFIALGLSRGLAGPGVQRAIAIGGGVLLLYIAARYLHGAWTGRLSLPERGAADPADRSTLALVGLGVATTLSNPFWYAWWVTVAAGYLAQAQAVSAAAVGAFYLGHISADFGWDTFLAAAARTGGRWLNNRRYRGLLSLTGGMMALFGLWFLGLGMGLLAAAG